MAIDPHEQNFLFMKLSNAWVILSHHEIMILAWPLMTHVQNFTECMR